MDLKRTPVARVFLCHSSSDKPIVRRIAAHLRKSNLSVWLDEREIRPGDSLAEKIADGISHAGYLLVFLSQRSAKSRWVKKELNVALIKELNSNEICVIPVLLEDCDLPTLLLDKVYVDFRTDFHQGIKQLVDAIRPPFPVDLPDHPLIEPNKLPCIEQAISEDMTEILRTVEDFGLNAPDTEKARENVKRFVEWYKANKSKMVAYGDPRIEKFDLIYFLATGKTMK